MLLPAPKLEAEDGEEVVIPDECRRSKGTVDRWLVVDGRRAYCIPLCACRGCKYCALFELSLRGSAGVSEGSWMWIEVSLRSSEVNQPMEELDDDEIECLCLCERPREEGTRAGTSAESAVDVR